MLACEAIVDTLGHRGCLVPDDVVAEDPAVVLECEGDAPGGAYEVLGRDGSGTGEPVRCEGAPCSLSFSLGAGRAGRVGVGVAEVEP